MAAGTYFVILYSTGVFAAFLVAAVAAQIKAPRFSPWLYWTAIITTTIVGTTLADFADRSLGIGYPGGSLVLLAMLLGTLFAWYRTLGTALCDWTADSAGLGYTGGIAVFVGLLTAIVLAYRSSGFPTRCCSGRLSC